MVEEDIQRALPPTLDHRPAVPVPRGYCSYQILAYLSDILHICSPCTFLLILSPMNTSCHMHSSALGVFRLIIYFGEAPCQPPKCPSFFFFFNACVLFACREWSFEILSYFQCNLLKCFLLLSPKELPSLVSRSLPA